MKKIVIVMAYFNRKPLLTKTLESINRSNHENFEVVIVDDASEQPLVKSELGKLDFPIHVINVKKEEKDWHCPVIPYNMGIEKALSLGAETIILQNPECYHIGDILTYTDNHINDESYISFSCYSINEKVTNESDWENRIFGLIDSNGIGAPANGINSWYNHLHNRRVGYDFCSAISVKNIRRINGYEERFATGVAYADIDLIHRIAKILIVYIPEPDTDWGLKQEKLNKRPSDYNENMKVPFVVHQWHYSGYNWYTRGDLVQKNLSLLNKLTTETGRFRAKHILTKDF